MKQSTLVFACTICATVGRRLQTSTPEEQATRNPVSSLASLLASRDPAVAFSNGMGPRQQSRLSPLRMAEPMRASDATKEKSRIENIEKDENVKINIFGQGDEGTAALSPSEIAELKRKEINRLKAAETFLKKATGDWTCTSCEYVYDWKKGTFGYPPNTPFELLPTQWICPKCKAPKAFFEPNTVEVAGFVENQAYGFGGNGMTEDQKSQAIFGGLFLGFCLMMSGYMLD